MKWKVKLTETGMGRDMKRKQDKTQDMVISLRKTNQEQ